MNNLNITGNQVNSGNLTISGTLQSFQTSILGTSVSVLDGKIESGNISTIWGTTSNIKQINTNDYVLLNANSVNSYFQIRNTSSTSQNTFFGVVSTSQDPFWRRATSSSTFRFQNNSASDIMTLTNGVI